MAAKDQFQTLFEKKLKTVLARIFPLEVWIIKN